MTTAPRSSDAKTRVFVAHSFDKEIPSGESKSDVEVANWFIDLLKHRPLGFDVVTGSRPTPARIDEKIKADIADCQSVIAIFTKRHHDRDAGKWLPPQFVLCEASSAIGFYYNTNRLICGFYEEGLNPQDLALITIGGLELIPFTRDGLESDRQRFLSYLKQIPEILATGTFKDGRYLFPGPPYSQQSLRKIYTVYKDGRVTVHNITTMLITDVSRFLAENHGEIGHEIVNRRGNLPPLDLMIQTPLNERTVKSFLHGKCRRINQRPIDAPLRIRSGEQTEHASYFFVKFQDSKGVELRLKNQDTIAYQYAWGFPHAYPAYEENLPDVGDGSVINSEAYNSAEVAANHGAIREMTLELRFERGAGALFDKSPFYQTTAAFSETPNWSRPAVVPQTDYDDDHEMWYSTFMLTERNFQGRLRVLWRPASQKHSK